CRGQLRYSGRDDHGEEVQRPRWRLAAQMVGSVSQYGNRVIVDRALVCRDRPLTPGHTLRADAGLTHANLTPQPPLQSQKRALERGSKAKTTAKPQRTHTSHWEASLGRGA